MPLAFDVMQPAGSPTHRQRGRAIVAAHPEVKGLIGRNPWSALWAVLLVSLQWLAAFLLSEVFWLWIFVAAYCFGAFVNHALYVLIHEASHGLVFRRKNHNKLLGIFCDFALVTPSAMAFREYHLLHHQHLGDYDMDPDIVCHTEARLVGNSAWRKTVWLFLFSLSQALRPLKMRNVTFGNRWIAANTLIVLTVDIGIFVVLGPQALAYLALSTLFALGLHPLGGRWIQEHYKTAEGQETYSYYGPLNRVCFNMGYHNEHHDMPGVPWNALPKVKKLAPEFYSDLKSYRSWTGLLVRFIFDPTLSTYSRILRQPPQDRSSVPAFERKSQSPTYASSALKSAMPGSPG